VFRLVTLNLNGIRSAASKGLEAWASGLDADCIGVQELKAQASDIGERFSTIAGLRGHFHFARKPGYSGVGLFARAEPGEVVIGFGSREFDAEGRYVELRFDDPRRVSLPRLSLISCYFPSGSSSEERQQAKFRFLARMTPHLKKLKATREFILVGDINIAHREIDLKNWKANQKNSGFTPQERAWMTHTIDRVGLVDVFRQLNPAPEQYTWWSNRGQARAKNVGWRLDYHLATPGIASRARREHIDRSQQFSDHAPLVIDYDFSL
jgi:exodeoxyribonuclease III